MAEVVRINRHFMVRLELLPEEAREVAYALGMRDEAARELFAAADHAERLQRERDDG